MERGNNQSAISTPHKGTTFTTALTIVNANLVGQQTLRHCFTSGFTTMKCFTSGFTIMKPRGLETIPASEDRFLGKMTYLQINIIQLVYEINNGEHLPCQIDRNRIRNGDVVGLIG